MKLDTLKREVYELNEMLTGGFIAKIYQPLPREIILKVRLATFGERRLLLSADPGLGRIHTTSLRIPNPQTPPRFCAYLRAHLQGSRIESLETPIDDRVVIIKCVRGKQEPIEKRWLILELLGRDSNILLVRGSDGSIMECLHRIYAKQEHLRSVSPGQIYKYPPSNTLNKSACNDKTGMVIGPKGPTESPDILVGKLNDPYKGGDCHSLDKALDSHYALKTEWDILESFRRTLQAPIRSRIRSLINRLGKIEEDRNRLERFAVNQKCGELIKFNLKKIHKGMTSVELFDWETNSSTKIPLDPSLSAVGNMESYFAKSAKARRGFSIVEERLEITTDEIKTLQDTEYMISAAKDIQELEQLSDEVTVLFRPKKSHDEKKVKKYHPVQARPFHEYRSPGGHKVLVGKSAKGNDLILRQVGDKNDLWFHAKDYPGAHVFLICTGNFFITDGDIDFSAALALRHSRGKDSGKGEVMMAKIKDVGRVKGAQAGRVKVKSFSSVMADCSEDHEES